MVWAGLESGLSLAISLGSVLALARLLGTVEFGLGSLAHGLVQIPVVVVGSLVHDALVQKAELSPADVRAGRLGSLFAALALALLVLASAQPLASLFGEPRLFPLMCALVPLLFFEGWSAPLLVLRRRAFDFAAVTRKLIAARAIAALVGVASAAFGLGAAAIVVQQLLASGLIVLLVRRDARDLPEVGFDARAFWALFRFCRPIVAVQLLIQGSERLFLAYVGHRLGLAAAGEWSLAVRVVENIASVVSAALYHVGLAFMSRLQQDRAALAQRLEEAIDALMLAVVPAVVALWVSADLLLLTILGPRWVASAAPVQLLALGTVFAMRRLMPTIALTAAGQPRANLNAFLAENATTVPLLFLWGPSSLVAVAALRGSRALFGWAAITIAAHRTLNRPFLSEFIDMVRDLGAFGLGLFAGTFARFSLTPSGWSAALVAVSSATVAALVAATALLALRPRLARRLVRACIRRSPARKTTQPEGAKR